MSIEKKDKDQQISIGENLHDHLLVQNQMLQMLQVIMLKVVVEANQSPRDPSLHNKGWQNKMKRLRILNKGNSLLS